jgi:hypothetical protein
VTNPFTSEQEHNLEWYFEEHLRFPFADKVRARDAGKSVYAYGEALFDQLLSDRRAYALWTNLRADRRVLQPSCTHSHSNRQNIA